MSLRWRWTLVLAAAAVGLMLVAGIGVESTLRARMGAESRAWTDARESLLGESLLETVGRLEASLDDLAADPALAEVFDLAQPTDAQRRVREDFAVVRTRRAGIGELLILDATGRILACTSHGGRVGTVHSSGSDLQSFLPRTGLVWREHVEGDPRASNWRLSVAEDVVLDAGRIRLVASALLDPGALREIRGGIGLGSLHFGPPGPDESLFEWPIGIEAIAGAHLSFSGGVSPELRALSSLRGWLFAAVGVALLIGFAGAPWIAAGFGRPLEEMSTAVARIGAGARSIELQAGGPPEVLQLQRALRQLVDDLKQTEERVRSAERKATWRELARHIAHEIRNVLSPLALALDNVETGIDRDREALAASLAVARDQLASLRRLASEFGEHARDPEPRFRLVMIEDLLESVAQTARAAFPALDLAFERRDPPDSVDADSEQLRRALHNLVKNAVEVSAEPRVTLRCGTGPSPSQWWIEVQDCGPGLPESVERSLGQPQVSTRAGGAGLGLAIVSQVAAAHGGAVAVRRPEEGGTVLRLVLERRAPAKQTGGLS